MDQNKIKYPFVVLMLTIGLLCVLSLFKTSLKTEQFIFRKVDMFSDLKQKHGESFIAETIVMDTVDGIPVTKKIKSRKVYDKNIIEYTDSNENSGLAHFYKALDELQKGKRKKVRIAYFGDSMIEADMISQHLRKMLQKKFGGRGVGFLPVTSISAQARSSVQHTFSDNWKDANFQNSKWGAFPFGFSGHVFYTTTTNCWFSVHGVNEERLKDFTSLKLFFGRIDSVQNITINGTSITLDSLHSYNLIEVSFEKPQTDILINMGANINLPVYGASLESDNGITLDNYSFRGITGIELAEIPGSYFRFINDKYAYDLIILHYGPNLLFKPELTDFSWFEKRMGKTLVHLKRNLPHASFLVIGSADKSAVIDNKWQTAPGVEPLIATQQKLAEKYHCAFWNLYANMGGNNSMVQWAEEKPILAGKDYTHFNYSGAQHIGTMLNTALLKKFQEYEKKN